MTTNIPFDSAPLSSLLQFLKDGTHGTHTRSRDGVPLLSAKNVTERGVEWNADDDRISEAEYRSIHRRFLLEADDLLLTVVGSLGRRALHDGSRITFQRSVAFLRADQQRLFPRFLLHAIGGAGFQRALVQRSNATAQAGVYLGELARIRIECPLLSEQHRIAAILDTIDEAIRKTEQVIAKLQQMKQGLLHDLLTRGIDENGELRDPERHPEQFQDSPLGRIPKAWGACALRDSCLTGGSYGSGAPARPYDPDLPRYVRITDITHEGRLDPLTRASISHAAATPYILTEGDLLFARSGATVGKTYLYDGPCAHAGYVIRFVVDRKKALPSFVFGWTKGQTYARWILRTLRQGAQPNINASEYARLPLALPPLPEQLQIVEMVHQIERRATSELQGLNKLRKLQHGLMDDLLTGDVRVPGEAAT